MNDQIKCPFKLFSELEKYVTHPQLKEVPTGIVIDLTGKYRVETTKFGLWFTYDTYGEAMAHIANWIKGEKDFEKGKAKNKDSGESRASSPT